METIQLQTNPICPKCKKGHTMRVCAFDVTTQEVSYQTECRVRPLVYQAKEMETINPSASFYIVFYEVLGRIGLRPLIGIPARSHELPGRSEYLFQ